MTDQTSKDFIDWTGGRPALDAVDLVNKLTAIEARYHQYMARWDAGPERADLWHTTAALSANDVGELLALLEEERAKAAEVEYRRNDAFHAWENTQAAYERTLRDLEEERAKTALMQPVVDWAVSAAVAAKSWGTLITGYPPTFAGWDQLIDAAAAYTAAQEASRPWCGAPAHLGGQQPCPIKQPCQPDICAIGDAAGDEPDESTEG